MIFLKKSKNWIILIEVWFSWFFLFKADLHWGQARL